MAAELTKDGSIEIVAVSNGYLVRPGYDYSRSRDGVTYVGEAMVFESFAGLVAWMETHFTHRTANVFRDQPPKID